MAWTQQEAIELCRRIEEVAPSHSYHVALTGGCLYKDGPRKDVDLLFYEVRQEEGDFHGLLDALAPLGFDFGGGNVRNIDWRWCVHATYDGRAVDLFFADAEEGNYGDEGTGRHILGDLSSIPGDRDGDLIPVEAF